MPRANRHNIPGQVWHLTHRCHKKEWLLKFSRDRLRWLHWLFKAKQRFGLCVLNYMVTSNHIHLLVLDQGRGEIAKSMQLIAGRTAQEFNRRKKRQGAFWQDRYHATAVQSDQHLHRCMAYIDLNMVRAGVVSQPESWRYCGIYEIVNTPQRKPRLDIAALLNLFDLSSAEELAAQLLTQAKERIAAGELKRESVWSEAVMIGDEEFIRRQSTFFKSRYPGLRIVAENDVYTLREPPPSYCVNF